MTPFLQASRLGITTVVSTDSIRHMMRSFVDEKENPLLWASTYHAGEFLDPFCFLMRIIALYQIVNHERYVMSNIKQGHSQHFSNTKGADW